jgi:hypothetical protein
VKCSWCDAAIVGEAHKRVVYGEHLFFCCGRCLNRYFRHQEAQEHANRYMAVGSFNGG